ncbi:hypothetical protein Goshw_014283 [Gossypium schwendimanii]|uniref:Uncharacterized protein n=1 Tax=Gossypium schwendimanii TaxID=34291 RepID=A0A7J9KY89_GOSSC|nr:hypothetical protein [Gossypium schwendimanii]
MLDYLSRIREGCDTLATCNSPISAIEHNSAILNGLPHDHDFFVAVITSSHEPYRVPSILMDAESRLQEPFRFPMSINTTQVTSPSLINIDSTSRLKLPTSSSSGFSFPLSSQAHFSGSVTPTHFVPRPRFLYLNRGRVWHLSIASSAIILYYSTDASHFDTLVDSHDLHTNGETFFQEPPPNLSITHNDSLEGTCPSNNLLGNVSIL